jgi:hypothetical protein
MKNTLSRVAPLLCVVTIFSAPLPAAAQELPDMPSFREVLSLPSVSGSVDLSPDGSSVLYTVSRAEWEANRYDTEIWLARPGREPVQLTRTEESSSTSPARFRPNRWSYPTVIS